MSTELFCFPLLFSGHFRSADPCVVSIVSGGCNQSSSQLFKVVFESLYRHVNAVFNAGKSSSSLFSWLKPIVCQRHLCDARPCAWSLVFLFSVYYYLHWSFSHQRQLMVFHWSLSDSKPLQVFRTLFRILAVRKNVVVWIVSTRPSTSKSSSPFSNPLVAIPKAPITIGIIVTFMFHSFFNSLTR